MTHSYKLSSYIRVIVLAIIFITGTAIGSDEYEKGVLESLSAVEQGNVNKALSNLDKITENYPTGKLAALIQADLMSISTGKNSPISRALAMVETPRPLENLYDEARVRWTSAQEASEVTKADRVPADAYAMGAHEHLIYVDLKENRLYVYKNTSAGPVEVQNHYVSIGNKGPHKEVEGDKRTPVGVYFVTSWIPGDKLPDLYGAGAFPINYPNSVDLAYNRTGYGIWLHGVPSDTYNREPLATQGCVALSNKEFADITRYIDADKGTPVILTDEPIWISRQEWQKNSKAVLARIEQWRKDWESRDTDTYLAHYSKEKFRSGHGGFDGWSSYKHRVNANKSFIDIDLDNINIYRYPGEDGLVVAYFDQTYRSNNINSTGSKELHLRPDSDNVWRITRETIFERTFDNRKPE